MPVSQNNKWYLPVGNTIKNLTLLLRCHKKAVIAFYQKSLYNFPVSKTRNYNDMIHAGQSKRLKKHKNNDTVFIRDCWFCLYRESYLMSYSFLMKTCAHFYLTKQIYGNFEKIVLSHWVQQNSFIFAQRIAAKAKRTRKVNVKLHLL